MSQTWFDIVEADGAASRAPVQQKVDRLICKFLAHEDEFMMCLV